MVVCDQNYIDIISGFFHDKRIKYRHNTLNYLDEDLSIFMFFNYALFLQLNKEFCFSVLFPLLRFANDEHEV
jgi:hypothetical protein